MYCQMKRLFQVDRRMSSAYTKSMGVSFWSADVNRHPLVRCTCVDYSCQACDQSLHLCGSNAADLFAHIGATWELAGMMPAKEVAILCERRLATLATEPALLPCVDGRVIWCGRPAGYLRDRIAELLRIALAAGEGFIAWG